MEKRTDFLNSLKFAKQRFTAIKGTLEKAKSLKVASAIMALAIPLTIAGCSGNFNTPTTTQTYPSTTIDNSSKQLDSEDSILKDFKQRYLAEYNKVNGTNFGIYDIELHMIPQTYLYVTNDGQYITHGQYPDKTKELLMQYDNKIQGISSRSIDGYVDLIQITRNEENLEAASKFFPRGDGDMISTSVLSATDDNLLSKLKSKEGLKKNTLYKYYDLANTVIELYNSSDENSKKIYIREYNKAIHEMDNPTTSFEKE